MKIQKFLAPTARLALQQARAALGDDAMVIANRPWQGGVELLVVAGPDMDALVSPDSMAQPSEKRAATRLPAPAAPDYALDGLMTEIRSMRGMLESQLATLAWSGQQPEARSEALRDMLAAGFSAGLSRYIAERMPREAINTVKSGEPTGTAWARRILARNLDVPDSEDDLLEQGGVFALVGPTGVGKTTTTAKLAARCVARHGPASLALVTTDSYRIGAFEQLRIYGKILGVMVHAVRDEGDLSLALGELAHKHIVLIDTAGAGQRDKMVTEQIAMLAGAGRKVNRLLCLNATSTADTLDEVVRAWRGDGLAGCLLTKLDEAASLGGALDVIIRHKLALSFVADGQRVPEDLHLANRDALVERAFHRSPDTAVFDLTNRELPLVAANTVPAMRDPALREVRFG